MIECVRNVKLGLSLCHKVRIATRSLVPASSLSHVTLCGRGTACAKLEPKVLLPLDWPLTRVPLPVWHADERVAQQLQMPSFEQGGTRWRPARQEV